MLGTGACFVALVAGAGCSSPPNPGERDVAHVETNAAAESIAAKGTDLSAVDREAERSRAIQRRLAAKPNPTPRTKRHEVPPSAIPAVEETPPPVEQEPTNAEATPVAEPNPTEPSTNPDPNNGSEPNNGGEPSGGED